MPVPAGLRRLRSSGIELHQLAMVLAGFLIVAAMVTIAEIAREDADRHRRAEVLVETIRAQSEALRAITYQELAESELASSTRVRLNPSTVTDGFIAFGQLSDSISRLRTLEPGAPTARLSADAAALYSVGLQTLGNVTTLPLRVALHAEQVTFQPVLDRLTAAVRAASTRERTVADRASAAALTAFVGSLAVGLIALLLIGWRLQRVRRTAAVAAERRAIEARSEERLKALVEHSTDVVTVLGHDLRIQWQAASVRRMLGHDPQTLVGRPLTSIVHRDDAELIEGFLTDSLSCRQARTVGARFRDHGGSFYQLEVIVDNRLDDPAVAGLVLSMRDVSERKALEDQLRHQAFHDPLTGLANRALFEDRLSQAVAGVSRHGRRCGVAFLDLDDFKAINDSLGHTLGDQLLRDVALRLINVLRPADTPARLGGDEFAILIDSVGNEEEACAVALRVLNALRPQFRLGDCDLQVATSVGVALWRRDDTVQDVLRNADMAMYAAKARGKDRVCLFEPAMRPVAPEQ